jgi:hypothetical protein
VASRDKRIDAYVAKAPPFARPILKRLRRLVHRGCPRVVETIKWRAPHFMLDDGMFCGMVSFKQHCGFYFWRGRRLAKLDPRFAQIRTAGRKEGMGSFGRITANADLPSDARLVALARAAAMLHLHAKPAKPKARAPKPPPRVPADLKAAMAKDAKARKHFVAFPPSAQRQYTDWITAAKRPETRARRLAATLKQLRANQRQNWEYASR